MYERNESAVKSTYSSCNRPEFSSQHPHRQLQPPVNSNPGDPLLSSRCHRQCPHAHMETHSHIHIYT